MVSRLRCFIGVSYFVFSSSFALPCDGENDDLVKAMMSICRGNWLPIHRITRTYYSRAVLFRTGDMKGFVGYRQCD